MVQGLTGGTFVSRYRDLPAMPPAAAIRPVLATDIAAIESLHDRAFGPGRFVRTAYRVREGLLPFSPLCRIALFNGSLAAALRMAPVTVGGRTGAQLLGPLAVEPHLKGQGFGKALVAASLEAARESGVRLVLLVGDLPYYERLGFAVTEAGRFDLGGPVDPQRLLGLALAPDALRGMAGRVRAELPASSSMILG
jgi:predicted N-acetyltransferase YhbS